MCVVLVDVTRSHFCSGYLIVSVSVCFSACVCVEIGFLRRSEDGSTSLKIINPDNSGIGRQLLVYLAEVSSRIK